MQIGWVTRRLSLVLVFIISVAGVTLGTDLAISVRGPAANNGIIGFKVTHGRIPMTGIWPRVPRRNWHVGPMARSVHDLALAYSLLAGPDGASGFSTVPLGFDSGGRRSRAAVGGGDR